MITLTDNEKILVKIRKHWMIILKDIVIFGSIVIIPIIIYIIFVILPFPNPFVIEGNVGFLWVFIISLWTLLFWILFFVAWTDYYLDILIVTNERVFDIEQIGLFNRNSATFRLDRIQDVSVDVIGILPTLFRFGHIHIQTAGEHREFVAQFIPHPYKIKELIMREHDAAMEKMQHQ